MWTFRARWIASATAARTCGRNSPTRPTVRSGAGLGYRKAAYLYQEHLRNFPILKIGKYIPPLSPRAGPSTFILDQRDENKKQVGLAQIRIRPGRPERDVVFISPALEAGNGCHAIWQRLLTHLCVQTAERGSLRIYARLPLQSEELQIFKNVGFIEYSQESIYQLNHVVNRATLNASLLLRPQQASDEPHGNRRRFAEQSLQPDR